MPVAGRRPGNRDTRADIVAAAREVFVEEGYQAPSLRSIARRAGVDPALIHHYFDGKADLFAEALKMGRDPRSIMVQLSAGPYDGTDLARAFLTMWDEGRPWDGGLPPFVTACQAMSASPQAAAGMREYLQERIWAAKPGHGDPETQALRYALVSSQLVGIAWARYLLQLEPVASAAVETVARWVGPTLDRYMHWGAGGAGARGPGSGT